MLGYARVSTGDQDAALQLDALEQAGCVRIFTDTASGAHAERPQLARLLDQLRAGDTVVVWRLDRLGRSLVDLIASVAQLEERGVGFKTCRRQSTRRAPAGGSSSTSSARSPSSSAT